MKYLLYFFMVVYVLSAAVQYNDPDPLVWIASYLLAAGLCWYRLRRGGDRVLFLALGLLYLLWGMHQFPPQWEGLMFDSMQMKTMNVEQGRESLGLVLCSLGMWVCSIK